MNKYFYLALFSLVYSCIGDDAEAPVSVIIEYNVTDVKNVTQHIYCFCFFHFLALQ